MTNQRSVNVYLDSGSTYRVRCCATALVELCVFQQDAIPVISKTMLGLVLDTAILF